MIYGPSYEGKTRECEACGHVTNVHYSCEVCNKPICEKCDYHGMPEHYCSYECFCVTCEPDDETLCPDYAAAYERRLAARRPAAPQTCVNCRTHAPRWNSIYCSDACKREFLTFSEDEDEDSCCPDYAAAYERRLEARAAYQEQFCGRNNY